MDFSSCDIMLGFGKSNHILLAIEGKEIYAGYISFYGIMVKMGCPWFCHLYMTSVAIATFSTVGFHLWTASVYSGLITLKRYLKVLI